MALMHTGVTHRRDWRQAVLRGLRSHCPACDRKGLFARYLKPEAACAGCGQAFAGHRADDFPPYLSLLVTGHLVVPLMLEVQMRWSAPIAVQAAVWLTVTAALALALLQPFKGAVIAVQWANRMHGFADPA